MNKPPANPRYSPAQLARIQLANIKEAMVEAVINAVYQEARNDLETELRDITRTNIPLVGSSHYSFMYKGKYYNLESEVATTFHDLHPSLHQRMEDYLEEVKRIEGYEVIIMRGALKSLFIASDRTWDYKLVLPEALHGVLDQFHINGQKALFADQLEAIKKRMAPSIAVIKGRMLHNRLIGRGQP